MIPWILLGIVLAAPFVYGITRETRTFRRALRAQRAVVALSAAPGWQAAENPLAGEYGLFTFLSDVHAVSTPTASGVVDGHTVIVTMFRRIEQLRGTYWLAVYVHLPHVCRTFRTARARRRSDPRDEYVPLADDLSEVVFRWLESDLPASLSRLGYPAVWVKGDKVCFLYDLPELDSLPDLVAGLVATVPAVTELAGRPEPDED
ncbi:hypothetical protein [Longispora urticae]